MPLLNSYENDFVIIFPDYLMLNRFLSNKKQNIKINVTNPFQEI